MGKRKNYLISCSATSHNFTLMYDGIQTYNLFYDGELVVEEISAINPDKLNKECASLTTITISENENPLIKKIYECIEDNLSMNGNFTDAQMKSHEMLVLKNIASSLRESYHSDKYTEDILSLETTPQNVQQTVIDLSAVYDENPINILSNGEIEKEIALRKRPVFENEETEIITEVKVDIQHYGLLPYLKTILDDIHIGNEHKNIYRKVLMAFNVMRGKGSYISETTAKAESGKTFEDNLVFFKILPSRYLFKADKMTEASFIRLCSRHEEFFARQIVYLGDRGNDDAFKEAKPMFNIMKPIITDKEYVYHKSKLNTDTDVTSIPLKADSMGIVYQTVSNSFTENDGQMESRTLFFTPPIVDSRLIMEHIGYLNFSKSSQARDKEIAEESLKNFGLFLMFKVNEDSEVINPYVKIFWEFASHSENPIREYQQQIELFDGYCHLTIDKCKEYKSIINEDGDKEKLIWASIEQLTEYMNNVNLENALIPYEYNFLKMIKADGKANELTILYTDYDITDEDGNEIEDINTDEITKLNDCEDTVIGLMDSNEKKKLIRVGTLEQYQADDTFLIQSKDDLTNQQLKEFSRRLISEFGIRSGSAEKKIFFRNSDLQNIYYRYKAYKDIENVPQLLQTLHKKGYIGKYEDKLGKENIYYLTPKCKTIDTKFKTDKSFKEYADQFLRDTNCDDILYN